MMLIQALGGLRCVHIFHLEPETYFLLKIWFIDLGGLVQRGSELNWL